MRSAMKTVIADGDDSRTLDVSGRDIAGVQEARRIFVNACRRRMRALRNALRSEDFSALCAKARSLRRMVTYLGAESLIEPALRLEVIGRSGELGGAEQAWIVLKREFDRLRTGRTRLLH